ncbi:hypothetical protein [Streptomyces sp. NPDC049881]|uniref:hypothetical protein n=1 Tax=Streptomyces sp. NPDC049881 TaxID=3155778 RepID=UPI003447440C
MIRDRYRLWTGEDWEDVTGDVRATEVTSLTYGIPDQATTADPASLALRFGNPAGRYSPGNPMSPLYGRIGPGTPLRMDVAGPVHLAVPSATGAGARTPGSTTLDVAGDLDVRVEVALDRLPAQWDAAPPSGVRPWSAAAQTLAARAQGTQVSWVLAVNAWGSPLLAWSPDGTVGAVRQVQGRAVLPVVSGERIAVRAQLALATGTVTFAVAPSLAGPWQQLGGPVGGAGPTSVYQPGAWLDLTMGAATAGTAIVAAGQYTSMELRDGGTLLAAPDWRTAAPGDTTVTDPQGNVWTAEAGSEASEWHRRTEVAVRAWPQRWDASDTDGWVPLRGDGYLRRLGRGAPPVMSTLRRRIPSWKPRAYWPLEEGPRASQAASGLTSGRPAVVRGLQFAADDSLPSSSALPTLQQGAQFIAPLPSVSAGAGWRVEMVYRLDSMPSASQGWFRIDTDGGGVATVTAYIGGGEARIVLRDEDNAVVAQQFWADGTALAAAVGRWCRVRLVAIPITGGYDYRLWWTPIGEDQSWYTGTASAVGARPYTRPTRVNCVWPTALNGMPIGHITYSADPNLDVYGGGTGGPDGGYDGERALTRMRRLAEEQQLPISVLGLAEHSPRMGPQRVATALELVQECAEVDGGILTERRSGTGLQYRSRAARYNQPAILELDYAAGHISPPVEPDDEAPDATNDITVARTGGSSAQAVRETGPLSVLPPPAGINRVEDSIEVNAYSDDQLEPMAWWRLHLGTWGGWRYPRIRINLRNPRAAGLVGDVLRVQPGSRITVANPPRWVPQRALDLVVLAVDEAVNTDTWTLDLTCAPAGPWTVVQLGHGVLGRIGTRGSRLALAAGASDTTLTVTGTLPWTTKPGSAPWDVEIGGEVMTVTAVSGTSVPQTWTVTRAVNGISKAHAVNAPVALATAAVIPL